MNFVNQEDSPGNSTEGRVGNSAKVEYSGLTVVSPSEPEEAFFLALNRISRNFLRLTLFSKKQDAGNKGFAMADQDNNLLFDCSSFSANVSDWLPNLNLLMEPNMFDNLKRVQIERSIQTVVRIMVIKVNKRRILKTRITETFLKLRFSLIRKQSFFDSPLNRRD
uniref:Uncharacterized protein n=1 Tax=Tetranychus urticae TaxID=32264 RepID=T1KSS7_TETUR